ncbi:hypothetical protein ABII15_38670 (plasmid) [Streptomyces sp. HUAS MG91]|uniref:Uncharacterized protein n=1 Tax=Streptomyces tabacisoli TaxID=3156398 RepID=A0AAU8J680_9ACTN
MAHSAPPPASSAAASSSSSSDELVAAALETHRALSRGLGRSVPLAALQPACGARQFAAFVAVYAAQPKRDEEKTDR